MKKAIKFSIATAGVVAALGVAVAPSIVSAWGDNTAGDQGRPSYTKAQIDAGELGNKITFNSISDNTGLGTGEDGNEKYFVAAREYNDTDTSHQWQAGSINIEDGKEYVIRMYVHNNSPKGRNAIAKDVRSYFKIPNYSSKNVEVTGYLDSSNATPTMYWDEVNFKSDLPFHLEYVGGSALINNKVLDSNDNPTGEIRRTALSDEIVTNKNGVLVGSESLNGEVPGCFEYDFTVTIRVKAYVDKDYTVDTKVRIAGDTDKTWKKSVDAKIGDKVEFQIGYDNTSDFTHNRVIIGDILPANLRYVPGSTILYNALHPAGMTMDRDSIIDDGLIIGNYEGGTNAFVRFTAEVVDETFTCGKFILRNWGRGSVGTTLIQDSADVNVQLAYCPNPEEPNPDVPVNPDQPNEVPNETPTTPTTPSELPTTGPVAIAGSVIGVGSVVTAAGYYVASRRALR